MRLAAVTILIALGLPGAAQAEDAQPATSDRARVAPGPSERTEPAAAEVRQAPVGGQTSGGTGSKPDNAERDKRP